MYKRIDTNEERIDGFSFLNKNGFEEKIRLNEGGSYVTIIESNSNEVNIYKEDIPMLIKGLQAAYDHKE